MKTGIYKITNNINGKCYIGRAIDINRRWTVHKRRAFVQNKEYDKYLYRAFRKYGIDKLPDTPDGFRAEVVKEIVGYKKVVDEEAGTCSSEKSHIETKYENKLYVK